MIRRQSASHRDVNRGLKQAVKDKKTLIHDKSEEPKEMNRSARKDGCQLLISKKTRVFK